MSVAADLTRISLVFASGSADQNREMIDRVAAAHPSLRLVVVAEFQPHRGEWIPWHVMRSAGENLAAVRAGIAGYTIEAAAMALAAGTGLGKMRFAAVEMAAGSLVAYDEDLNVIGFTALPLCLARRAVAEARKQLKPGGRANKWLRSVASPSESEIPVRARLAQIRGVLANRFRGYRAEIPLSGTEATQRGITVVVPSRDGRELLSSMLPPLLSQLTSGEIIVVDNGAPLGTAESATESTAAWLAREYPEIRVVQSPAPLSFARAVNSGIVAARYDRILLLNNDMVVESGFVAALEAAFDNIPDLYCATAQIFFPPGIRREETGKAVWRREGPLDFPMRCDDPHPGEDLTWVFYGSGGCSLFDTAKLRQMGGVSEVYEPAYVEDMDFGFRAWKRGWPSVYCAAARVEHRHRATTARFYTARQLDFFVERNYLRFLIHAISSRPLFERLWLEAIRRLQLLAMNGCESALDVLRDIPHIGPRPPEPAGVLTENEILALGNGDIACFPGRAPRAARTILIASPYLPFPLAHGGAVRIFNLMKQAAEAYDLVLMAFCDELSTPPAELLELCCEVVLVRRHGTHYRRNTDRPDVVEEFDSQTFRACLKQTARRWKPSVVQLEFTWMAQYAGVYADATTVLVEHDITFDLQQQLLATSDESGAARWELERQTRKWREFETGAWREVDCVVTMSSKDSLMVTGARDVVTLPNGVDCARFNPSSNQPESGRLLFIGSFAHLPNLLALEFFLKEIWPRLGEGFTLHVIAGARPDYFRDFHRSRVSIDLAQRDIELEGFVGDVRPAYERAELVLATLTASAGTNIKVLEAMAMGRAVVSTPAGINGLDLAPGHDVIVESDSEALAREIRSLSGDRDRRRALEKQARQTALRFDWSVIAKRQSVLYDRVSKNA